MTTQLRATGLSEEQREELALQLDSRGIAGWEYAGEPREVIGEGDEATYGPQKYGFTIPANGETDLASLTRYLDQQHIAHALEQDTTATSAPSEETGTIGMPGADYSTPPEQEPDEQEPEAPAEDAASTTTTTTSGKHVDDTKEHDA